jgi:hypothetical protein
VAKRWIVERTFAWLSRCRRLSKDYERSLLVQRGVDTNCDDPTYGSAAPPGGYRLSAHRNVFANSLLDWVLTAAYYLSSGSFGDRIPEYAAKAVHQNANNLRAWGIERGEQASLLRDIAGNPFRPVTISPTWQTANVVAIAQAIYDERGFDRLPILADALEDAGCTNVEILEHCRAGGEHVRGCWVVDLLLGKE